MLVCVNETFSENIKLQYSVPQGSCCGVQIFNWYASTVQGHITNLVDLNAYADDHTLKSSFDPNIQHQETHILHELTSNLWDVNTWMQLNRLKMNAEKTELIYFGSLQQLAKSKENLIKFNSENIPRLHCIKYLGAWLDENLKFWKHIKMPAE